MRWTWEGLGGGYGLKDGCNIKPPEFPLPGANMGKQLAPLVTRSAGFLGNGPGILERVKGKDVKGSGGEVSPGKGRRFLDKCGRGGFQKQRLRRRLE